MGFMDKLKAAKNFVTGGQANVFLQVENPSFSEPFNVRITVNTKDAEVKINNAYVLIEGVEEVRVIDADLVNDGYGGIDIDLEEVEDANMTVDMRTQVAGPQVLEPNKEYVWEATLRLPAGAQPTYLGQNCRHVYRIQAGIDCFGNDPDSGWQALRV